VASEENKMTVYRFVNEGLNRRNRRVIDEVCAGDYVGHDPEQPYLRRIGDLKQAVFTLLDEVFPDARYITESLTAEDDMVVWHWSFHATHQGEWMGAPPTGKKVVVSGVNIFRLANCKIVEEWVYRDTVGMLRQLGLFPSPPAGR
jgi:predicted ester cyclase